MDFVKYAEQFVSYQGKPIPPLSTSMVESVYSAAYLSYEQGSYQNAEELFLYLLCHQPSQPSFWKGLASSQQMQKKYLRAKQAWLAFLTLVGNNAEGLLHLSECFLSLNIPTSALKYLNKILQLPKISDNLLERTNLLKKCAQVKIDG